MISIYVCIIILLVNILFIRIHRIDLFTNMMLNITNSTVYFIEIIRNVTIYYCI
jgi:hypothetical protein